MSWSSLGRWPLLLTALALMGGTPAHAGDVDQDDLAKKAQAIFKANCHRCHGKEGAAEGGFNYILNLEKLVASKKVVPGKPDQSPLYNKVSGGKMPPPEEKPRPSEADVVVLKQWIEAGAPTGTVITASRPYLPETEVFNYILADLDKMERRNRRFARYFTLTNLHNAGYQDDELQTYRLALAKLINSLSWHPRISNPVPIDPAKTILRIDLREYMWDANLWNRLLVEYPYGIQYETATARACYVNTATRMPVVRADWFIATASRPPLYHELLQLPGNVSELERQLRVDVNLNIQQDRVARGGFNGSGVAKNNRLIERHDAVHGAYWKSYDFEAPQNPGIDRINLIPDRRNLFAYPLGPGLLENNFQHAGGEIIYNLPNGLQAYMLIDARGQRIDKAPTAIVSDPKRPDRAVENGVSCIYCHAAGIIHKSDQIRDYVEKNPKAFSRTDRELILALYPPDSKMKALVDEDSERFQKALAKTGVKLSATEPIMLIATRYEADVDLPSVAGEIGLKPDEFLERIGRSETLSRNLGSLKVGGGTVSRQVLIQSFGDIVREMRLGVLFQPVLTAITLPDNTGEIDPLEGQTSNANAMAFTRDGRFALFASADKTVRLWDVERERELKRFIGHTASVWAVAFSPDGKRALSGGADGTMRLWDVETAQEIRRFDGHTALVTCVAFTPDGKKGLSGSYDHTVILWDLDAKREIWTYPGARYINCLAVSRTAPRVLVGGGKTVYVVNLDNGKEVRRLEGHADSVVSVAFSTDGKRVLTGSDDRTVRLWDAEKWKELRPLNGHEGPVKSVLFSSSGSHALTASSDATVRVWNLDKGEELRKFSKHSETVIHAAFFPGETQTISGSRDSAIKLWQLPKDLVASASVDPPIVPDPPPPVPSKAQLRPAATIPLGGTVGNLILSPNGKWLYYLNLADRKLGRIDTTKLRRAGELRLADGTESLCLTPDGKMLYASATVSGHISGLLKGNTSLEGRIQVIDPTKMQLLKAFSVAADPYEVVARDDGLVFVTGGSGEWTEISVIDVKQEKIVASWGGVWTKSFLRLTPDQSRLYFSTQGVSPGSVEALVLPETLTDRPVQYKSQLKPDFPLGGEIVITPDGKHLLSKTGTVLKLSANKDEDLQPVASVEPFHAAVVDAETEVALVLTRDGVLKHYSYPDFKLLGSYSLDVTVYQAAFDAKQGRLYAAVFDPKAATDRPLARGLGDIYVYDLKEVLKR